MTLHKGASGPLVKKLQHQLINVLKPSPNQPENGHFGDATQAAVVRWQKLKGLPADGVVGPKTWAALDGAPISPIVVAPSQSVIPTSAAPFNPLGKTFDQRLDAWLADVKNKYHVTITKVGGVRTPADAQRWHIAYMIKYTSFAN